MKELVVDDALKPGLESVLSSTKSSWAKTWVRRNRQKGGARLAYGGKRLTPETESYYMAPAIFTETAASMRMNREEIFGPVASVIRVRNYEEALAVANETPYRLSAGIVTTSLKYTSHFKRHSQSGLVMVNLPTARLDYHVHRRAEEVELRSTGAGRLREGVVYDCEDS